MNQIEIRDLQLSMRELGLYSGEVDGQWGPISRDALRAVLAAAAAGRSLPTVPEKPMTTVKRAPLAWGAKVSPEFRKRLWEITDDLGVPPSDMMSCMAFETGETFSPDVRNKMSGATGLIQFMPKTAAGLGTSTDALARMTAVEQLTYVYRYFLPYKGRLHNLGDVYCAILWPAGIGKPDGHVFWSKMGSPITFNQNAGLDANKDGLITRGEALAKIQTKLTRGMQPGYIWSE